MNRPNSLSASKHVKALNSLLKKPKFNKQLFQQMLVAWTVSYMIFMSFFFKGVLAGNSYIEIFPSELLLPTAMHAISALLVTVAVFYLSKLSDFTHKLLAITLLSMALLGYDGNLQLIAGIIRAFIPGITEADSMAVISLLYIGILFVISVTVARLIMRTLSRYHRISDTDIRLGLIAFVVYVFIFPALSVARIVPTMVKQSATLPSTIASPSVSTASEKPDIYYIVLDRYANKTVLQEQFDFDNSDFTDSLRSSGFTVNDNAYSNYPYTAMSIASTMNLNYTNDLTEPYTQSSLQSRTLYHNLIRQSSLVKALKREGYTYHALGSWYGATNKAPLADDDITYQQRLTVFGMPKRLRGVEASEFTKSPYFRFTQIPGLKWWPFSYQFVDHISTVRRQLQELDQFAKTEKPGGRFIFAHILVPHEPFAFNADGSLSLSPGNDSTGKPIKDKYTAQVRFINEQMERLVATILKNSGGKSIIVLNSDEGPYPQFLNDSFMNPQSGPQTGQLILANENMKTWSDNYIKMKFGILQAVHMPQSSPDDLSHISSVNAFRILLNTYFNYELEYLPDCYFGLSKGGLKEFTYADITDKLTEVPSPSCRQLATDDNE